MAKRNFTRQTASLHAFLQTGKLGPISCGLPLLDVAAQIGPPRWWVTDVHDFPFPLNWGYAGLEMSFLVEPPHRMDWFKIDPAQLGRTRYHGFCPRLRLSFGDIPIFGRPSMLLASNVWNSEAVGISLHLGSDEPRIVVSAGGVEILYVIYDEDVPKFSGLKPDQSDDAIALLDEHAVLHGIYVSSDQAALGNRWLAQPWHSVSVQAYLQIVAAGRSVSPA